MEYQRQYLDNQRAFAKRQDEKHFEKRGKVDEKILEHFKRFTGEAVGIAHQVQAQGYDTNAATNLENLLAKFQALYNSYAFDIVRNPQNKLSEPMRQIMTDLKNILATIAEINPRYGARIQQHLSELDKMYVRTGGAKCMRGGNATGSFSGSVEGPYSGSQIVNLNYYEPSIQERMAREIFVDRNAPYQYSKLAFNEDRN
jgi:hypothetical protein